MLKFTFFANQLSASLISMHNTKNEDNRMIKYVKETDKYQPNRNTLHNVNKAASYINIFLLYFS